MTMGAPDRPRRRTVSPITRRILAVNVLALGILVAGLLYLGQYRQSLIDAELTALMTQADMFAAALGEGAVSAGSQTGQQIVRDIALQIVRRLVQTTGTRARLFGADGVLLADSRLLMGPGGMVQIRELPPPDVYSELVSSALEVYDRLVLWLPGQDTTPPYHEKSVQRAEDYDEVPRALAGEKEDAVRAGRDGGIILSVAVPVQRYKKVLGALMLSKGSRDIEAALFEVRLDILKVFAVALSVTVLLSIYLAGTIARPIRRLAAVAERLRRSRDRRALPDFAGRNDEIGDLARSLHDMTEALWERMEAIERFAADVAHEIKNPLTSLRSAVETAARVKDAEKQRTLMTIIQDDVQRLDRLISDISDASRLDSELLRAERAPVDIGRILGALAEVHEATAEADAPRVSLDAEPDLVIDGVEGRLAQVFRNLIANAVSFGPPASTITLAASREGDWAEVKVDDEGPGIPDGKQAAIFDRFYTERPEPEKFGTHSGLGLSISKQIVEAHGGTVHAENLRGDDGRVLGARFVVRLPLA